MTTTTLPVLRTSAASLLDRFGTVETALAELRASVPRWESALVERVASTPLDDEIDSAAAALDQKIRLAPKRIEGLQAALIPLAGECEGLADDFVAALRGACAEALAVMIEREIDLQRRHFPDDGTGILAHAAAQVAPLVCGFRLDASARLSPPSGARGAGKLRWALAADHWVSSRIAATVGHSNEGSREPEPIPAPVAPSPQPVRRGPGRPRKHPVLVPA